MRRPPGSTAGPRRSAPRKAQPAASAYALCLRWLTVRDRTEVELRRKLAQKEIAPPEIDAAIERIRGLGYLDDARFAKVRAEGLLARGRLGPRGVAARLAAAGLSREQVGSAVRRAMEGRSELDLARAALLKKHPAAVGTSDPKLRSKAVRFLLGRGFSADAAGKALDLDLSGADE